jgi:hypothetical protein
MTTGDRYNRLMVATAHSGNSFSERQNLTIRMHIRRFARLTNAFGEKTRCTRQPWRFTSCRTTL